MSYIVTGKSGPLLLSARTKLMYTLSASPTISPCTP